MPCYDARDADEKRHAQQQLPMVEAALCGLMTALKERGMLEMTVARIDWEEAGVTEEWFRQWWNDHKARDQGRG